jgi:HD-like signal output (HDOD) protein
MNVAELLERIQEVCPLPATSQRVVQLAQDPKARIEQLASVIATDPALASEVMRIANSAAFGRARQVSELETAVVLIGMTEIHRMAAAMAMLATFRSKHELTFNFHDKAVLAGSIARALAPRFGVTDKSQAFLCGLLTEIGAMACAAVDAEEYLRLWRAAAGDPAARSAAEVERYGAPSEQVGGQLLRRNALPDSVAVAVESDPLAPDASPLVRLTGFSRRAAAAVVSKSHANDLKSLAEALDALRAPLNISVPVEELTQACIEASGTALTAMRRAR